MSNEIEDAKAHAELAARVSHIEKEQARMSAKQDEILKGLDTIQSMLDKAAGGATAIRWVASFLGLGSLSGCLALAMWVANTLHK